jgi:hypothetical protein
MAQKKKSSCLGLFVKGFILSGLVLAVLCVAGVMIGIKFMGADPALWTDTSHWNTRLFMLLYGVTGISFCLGFVISLAGVAVSAIFGSGKKESAGSSSPKRKARPQSNRKTTI